jgi:hypothetical protein
VIALEQALRGSFPTSLCLYRPEEIEEIFCREIVVFDLFKFFRPVAKAKQAKEG